MKYNILLCVLPLLLTLTGCSEDWLDEQPTDAVSADAATESTDNLFAIINGIHRLMYERQGSNGRGGYSAMMIQHDALGEDLVMNAQANGWWISMASWNDHTNATDSDLRHGWRVMYQIINNANRIIAGAEAAEGDAATREAALGEAYAYRAFAHYFLVQRHAERYNWGGGNDQQGIPLILEPTTEGVAPSSVEDVYAQVNSDLDQAISLLDGFKRPTKSHINQAVAQGLKARVNHTQGNWQTAADFAVQAREGYPLMDSVAYTSGFNDYSNDEWLWGGYYNEEQGSAFTNFGAWMSRNFSSSNIRGNPKSIYSVLYETIPQTDVRAAVFSESGEHNNLPAGYEISSAHRRFPYTSQKFLSISTGDSRGDVPYMRAAEMYLIEAESLARLGAGGAEALYPLAIARDPAYELSTNTGQDLIDEILLQRRWELWGEGFRFLDLKRLDMALDRTSKNGVETNHNSALLNGLMTVAADDPRWVWLIPQDEINANPNITQVQY